MPLPRPSPTSWPAAAGGLAVALAAVIGSTGGCTDSTAIAPEDIRRFTVPAAERRASLPPATVAQAGPAPRQLRLTYQLPAGWTDRGGGGLRLATLAIGAPGDGHEVTVIPAAGTLESNVTRWQVQLDPDTAPPASEAAVRVALEQAETVPVGTSSATIVFLTGSAADDAGDGRAILGAMIPLDDKGALFVKYMGEAAVARRERDRFVEFVKTIRWQ